MSKKDLSHCRKIGIMGGTFNPIHIGHLLMGRWAKEFAHLDVVLFIPAGNPYMKAETGILDGQERLQMVDLSIRNEKDFLSSDIEIRRSGNTYTYETLTLLRERYSEAELYFIAGADCLYTFEKWLHPEGILQNCTLIAAARNGAKMEELCAKKEELTERFGGRILLMEFPAFDVSSTGIRDRVKNGKSIRYLTTDAVCEYIAAQKFYL